MPSPESAIASSGIQTTTSGERHIPQSVRADGSVRREIKIRPGYRPPEDVGVYKNRTAEGWKSRVDAGVPGAEGLQSQENSPSGVIGKNAKRREARRKARSAGAQDDDPSAKDCDKIISEAAYHPTRRDPGSDLVGEPQTVQSLKSVEGTASAKADPEVEAEKQARNIKKRLRQARDLQNKKENGESLLPEQFAKVIKIQELIRQLDALGFGSDGSRKPKDVR